MQPILLSVYSTTAGVYIMVGPTGILLLALLLFSTLALDFKQRKTWDYSIVSIQLNSSNEKLMKPRMVLERISRGNFAFSGTIELKYDITKDTKVELIIYRSTTGTSSTYKLLPYRVPKQTFLEFMNSYYKDIVMESLKNCSNLPQFHGELQVLEQKTYEFKYCKFSNEKLPTYAAEGFYKLVASIVSATAPMEAIGEMLVKIETAIV